ncbi:MAG: DUF58 domain-containing protein [Planctomycetes bacterium]|nr:DUF58 domain-containing protein [Planctomycetota bacterium]
MAIDTQRIFDPAFLRSLEALRIVARRVPAGGRLAEQPSKARGAGVEFSDVRPYVQGDDIRAIDWNLWQRFEKAFLKLFLHEEDLPVHVLLDESASMALPPLGRSEPRDKTTAALQAVAALAFVAAEHLDRVGVTPFADASGIGIRGITGSASFHRLLAWLVARSAGGRTDLVAALRELGHRRLRRGLLVVVSDFLDPRGAGGVVDALRALPHTPCLLRIAHPHEARPPLSGELELEDHETGERLPLFVDEAALDRFATAHAAHCDTLRAFARTRRGRYLEIRTGEPVVPQVATLFTHGALSG